MTKRNVNLSRPTYIILFTRSNNQFPKLRILSRNFQTNPSRFSLMKKQQQMDNLSIFSIPYSSVPESEHYGKFKTDTKFVFFSLFRISVNAWGWRKNCYHYLTIKFARGLVPRYHGRHHNF